jgi:regulator of cell morphogenesis and NO signaling
VPDYIAQTHHAYIRKNLPLISRYLLQIAIRHGDQFVYMKRVFILFTQVRTELEHLLAEEEDVVFPEVKKLLQQDHHSRVGDLQWQIMRVEESEAMAARLMKKIFDLTDGYAVPEGACGVFSLAMEALRDFDDDLRAHVDVADNVLFARVLGDRRAEA